MAVEPSASLLSVGLRRPFATGQRVRLRCCFRFALPPSNRIESSIAPRAAPRQTAQELLSDTDRSLCATTPFKDMFTNCVKNVLCSVTCHRLHVSLKTCYSLFPFVPWTTRACYFSTLYTVGKFIIYSLGLAAPSQKLCKTV